MNKPDTRVQLTHSIYGYPERGDSRVVKWLIFSLTRHDLCWGLWQTDVDAGEKSAADFVRLKRDITSRGGDEAVGRLGSGAALACRVYATTPTQQGESDNSWR
jgi:hypothetical protein